MREDGQGWRRKEVRREEGEKGRARQEAEEGDMSTAPLQGAYTPVRSFLLDDSYLLLIRTSFSPGSSLFSSAISHLLQHLLCQGLQHLQP